MYFLSTNEVIPDAVPEDFRSVIKNHIKWIEDKIREEIVVQAGKWGQTRGMCLIRADSRDEALKILEQDPLIASGAVSYLLDEYYSNVPLP